MHDIERTVVIPIPALFGMDLSITNEVILLWIAALVCLVVMTAACRRRTIVATGPLRNLAEALIEFIDRSAGKEILGKQAAHWSTFLLTLFFFILSANLMSLLPLPSHVKAMTSNISVTAALALIVFLTTVAVSIRHHGVIGFLSRFAPSGLPLPVRIFAFPIEVISWLARPLSLAVRLFANMLAGHALILIFLGMAGSAAWFLKPLPYAGAVIMSVFELIVGFLQAFIFTLLAGMYIKDALDTH
jgi:F-type H+-transporting ATPase subunit a